MTLPQPYILHATVQNFIQCAKQSAERSKDYGRALRQVSEQNFACPIRVAPKMASSVVRKLVNSVHYSLRFLPSNSAIFGSNASTYKVEVGSHG